MWQDPSILFGTKTRLRIALGCLLLASLSCSSKSKHRAHVLPPLTAPSWSIQLDVTGFGPATVALPLAATTPRPIVVVLHGAHDRAQWQCGNFRGLLGGRVFIVCPQGIAIGDGSFGLGSVDDSEAELRAALKALKARFGAHAARSPIVLMGYAEGGVVAADLARQEPSFFARVAVVAGNPAVFSPTAAKIFAEHGGKRVLFFCGNDACGDAGVEHALLLQRAQVAAKSVKAEVGPYFDQRFADALRPQLPWLLEGDQRFGAHR